MGADSEPRPIPDAHRDCQAPRDDRPPDRLGLAAGPIEDDADNPWHRLRRPPRGGCGRCRAAPRPWGDHRVERARLNRGAPRPDGWVAWLSGGTSSRATVD